MASSANRDRELTEFWLRLRERLEAGARSYGDVSFTREPTELASEIEQELLDVCGWAFILWCRARKLACVMRFEDRRT
jgi:hypothetical protein